MIVSVFTVGASAFYPSTACDHYISGSLEMFILIIEKNDRILWPVRRMPQY